jgi:ribosomal protein L14
MVPNTTDPNGAPETVTVQVGLSDGTYTQITKGLNVGDQVIVQVKAATTNTNSQQQIQGGVIIMPAGGAPPGVPGGN